MKKCPFFGRCGGCKYDFADANYRATKLSDLHGIVPTGDPVWILPGVRRRADFCFAGPSFGFFASRSKDIVPVTNCPNLVPEINAILPDIARLPWCGAGSCLITACDNGIDIAVTSDVAFFTADFRDMVQKLPILRLTWNNKVVFLRATPVVSFDERSVEYPSGAFLQPSRDGADALRKMVVNAAVGCNRVVDLFCGLGNFTFALSADGFDIFGTGVHRDLFKNPLTPGMLRSYDCVVMDPPRAGALAQCNQLVQSDVSRVIYVSCNPVSWRRDCDILTRGGYRLKTLIPVDQFAGSSHWEVFSVFEK